MRRSIEITKSRGIGPSPTATVAPGGYFPCMAQRPSNLRLLARALARRCPNCGASGIFASYTELRDQCPRCGLRLHRGESDYFIGAYLLNLVAVELLFAFLLAVVVVATYPNTPWDLIQYGGLALMIVGAVACYPFAKAIWLAVDLIFRPMTDEDLPPAEHLPPEHAHAQPDHQVEQGDEQADPPPRSL